MRARVLIGAVAVVLIAAPLTANAADGHRLFRPSKRSSVDVVFHRYTQERADVRVVKSNLESRPRGAGDAFDSAAEAATFHQPSIRYGF